MQQATVSYKNLLSLKKINPALNKFSLIIASLMVITTPYLRAQCSIVKVDDSIVRDVEKLSLALTETVVAEYEKACRIFEWIRGNIRYDSEAYRQNKKRINATTTDVLIRREAVCLGYAQLFADMCGYAGLKAFVIDGHSKQGDYPPKMEEADHAWNAVLIDGTWQLLDVTWAADARGNQYFCTPPEIFIKEHLPADPMWQLLSVPVSAAQFKREYLPMQQTETPFAFKDSISKLLVMPENQQKIQTAQNTYLFNPTTSNKELLGHAYVDYALSFGREAERLQTIGNSDSLSVVQMQMITNFRKADKYTPLLDWQRDNFANVLINEAVNISGKLQLITNYREGNQVLEEMKILLLEAKTILERQEIRNFPSQTLQICEEYLKWVESYWD
jgi:hypothetical protein